MLTSSFNYIHKKTEGFTPEYGIILGSGLSYFADHHIEDKVIIPYHEIPDFPCSTVPGHRGNLVFGRIGEKSVLCMQGRFHLYEGYSMQQVSMPVKLASELGVKKLFVTNAAGGIKKDIKPGELMFIDDHINFLGDNPLVGQKNIPDEKRFPDMTTAYDAKFIEKGLQIAYENNIQVCEGVYLATKGPSFETPAEIRAFRTLGADAVGMSTIPEVIIARQENMRVCGISCISNLAAGISLNPLSHQEVNDTVEMIKEQFAILLSELIKRT